MAICPKCKEVVEELKYSAKKECWGYLSVDDRGFADYDENECGDWSDEEYLCPECDELLFTNGREAEKFLKDTDKLKEIVQEKINKKRGKNV